MMLTIEAHDALAGDLWHRPNWDEHIRRAWPDTRGIAIVTEEYPEIVQHLALAQLMQVDR